MISSKNTPLSPAANDLGLGLGDQLQSQVDAQLAQRKKKMLQMQAGAGLSPAATNLLSGGLNA